MLDMEKVKNYKFANATYTLEMTGTSGGRLLDLFWFYCNWLSGKYFANSLCIKSVGTAMFTSGSSSKNLKLLFSLCGEEQEMPSIMCPGPWQQMGEGYCQSLF